MWDPVLISDGSPAGSTVIPQDLQLLADFGTLCKGEARGGGMRGRWMDDARFHVLGFPLFNGKFLGVQTTWIGKITGQC